MKLFVGFALSIWLICGLIGAWVLEGGHHLQIKTIALGPISLVKAINEHPVTYPGP